MQENHFMNKIQQFFSSPSSRLFLYFLIPTVIILILIIVISTNHDNKQLAPTIIIDNFSEVLPDAPSYTRREAEEKLYEKVKNSLPSDTVIPKNGAEIILDSLYSFSLRTSFSAGDFIVKIDSLNLSYIVKYFYGILEGENEIEGSVSVLIYDLNDSNYRRDDPIMYLAPKNFPSSHYSISYAESINSTSGYSINVMLDPPESVYLSGKVAEFRAKAEDEVRSYLESNGLILKNYEITYDYKIIR